MNNFDKIPASSKLLDESLMKQIGDIFQKLSQDVYLVTIVDSTTDKCLEMVQFVKTFASIHEFIKLEIYEKNENLEVEKQIGCDDKIPMISVCNAKHEFSGISFCGIPGGKEINSLVLAIYNVAGPGQSIEAWQVEAIKKIENKVSLEVCVSLACHYCADTVNAAQRIASLNPNVSARMVDATLFPKLVEQYHIERVPMMIINGERTIMGAKTLEEILKEIS